MAGGVPSCSSSDSRKSKLLQWRLLKGCGSRGTDEDMEASHRATGWQTTESPGAAVATFMSWYTVDTRMSGGSVRVILKATLLPPAPLQTASEEGRQPCKTTEEAPKSRRGPRGAATAPGDSAPRPAAGTRARGRPASAAAAGGCILAGGRSWKKAPSPGCKSRRGWQGTHGCLTAAREGSASLRGEEATGCPGVQDTGTLWQHPGKWQL